MYSFFSKIFFATKRVDSRLFSFNSKKKKEKLKRIIYFELTLTLFLHLKQKNVATLVFKQKNRKEMEKLGHN